MPTASVISENEAVCFPYEVRGRIVTAGTLGKMSAAKLDRLLLEVATKLRTKLRKKTKNTSETSYQKPLLAFPLIAKYHFYNLKVPKSQAQIYRRAYVGDVQVLEEPQHIWWYHQGNPNTRIQELHGYENSVRTRYCMPRNTQSRHR